MDIDLLSKMVKELILDNDRVVLPGLGCFVAEIVPSVFSDKGYTINPPYRKLSFRARPDRGEELAKFYAGTNNVAYDIADRIITDFVTGLKAELHQKKTVVFPGLGRLRATKENNVFFVADENLDIYPAGFGLEPVSLKTHQQTHEEVSAAIEGLRSIIGEQPACVQPVDDSCGTEAACEPEPVEEVALPETPHDESDDAGQEEAVLSDAGSSDTDPADTGRPVRKIILWTMAGIVSLLIIAIAVYMALAIYAPEILDGLLYTPEELDILNYKL